METAISSHVLQGSKKAGYLKVELKGKPCNLSLRDLELVVFRILG